MGRGKNRHIHFVTDEDLYQKVNEYAKEQGLSKAEVCRIRLRSEKSPVPEEITILRKLICLIKELERKGVKIWQDIVQSENQTFTYAYIIW